MFVGVFETPLSHTLLIFITVNSRFAFRGFSDFSIYKNTPVQNAATLPTATYGSKYSYSLSRLTREYMDELSEILPYLWEVNIWLLY